jgi:hypothetical protein
VRVVGLVIVLLRFVFFNKLINAGSFERVINGVPFEFLNVCDWSLEVPNDGVHVANRCVDSSFELIHIIDLQPMVKDSKDLWLKNVNDVKLPERLVI